MAAKQVSAAAQHPAGSAPTSPGAGVGQYPREFLQQLVDQAACFNLFVLPDGGGENGPVRDPGGSVVGIRGSGRIHRFGIELSHASVETGVRASNTVGEVVGRVRFRWMVVPHEFLALPEREPPPTGLDRVRSQRFAMQEMELTFGSGRDGFRAFGAGRTFPMPAGGESALMAAAVGDITECHGKFAGVKGNFTLCGRLMPEHGFQGHIIVRLLDPDGKLRTQATIPAPTPTSSPERGLTYLMWGAQKGKTPQEENRFSVSPDGQVRGLNIPVQLRHLSLEFDLQGPTGFRTANLCLGEAIGTEVGFGRGSIPNAPPTGTPRSPYLFEGVARYSFHDRQAQTVGAITTNVVEGRRFDVLFAHAPDAMSWRFGFFGPVIYGSGSFRGAHGVFYGASGSVFNPPPGDHVVTHLYYVCLADPGGRFRTPLGPAS